MNEEPTEEKNGQAKQTHPEARKNPASGLQKLKSRRDSIKSRHDSMESRHDSMESRRDFSFILQLAWLFPACGKAFRGWPYTFRANRCGMSKLFCSFVENFRR
jgi:hypothetical protein